MQDMTTKNRLSRFFASVHHPGSVLNLRSIRREVLPYFIGWIAVFTWLYSCFLPGGNLLFLPTNQLTGYEQIMTYIWLIACPLITLGFEGIHYVPKTIYSAISALLAFIGIVFLTIGPAAILFHILCAIALGHAFASFAYGFFMILNNVERFFSMIFGVLFPKLLLSLSPLLRQFLVGLSVQEFIYLCCLLLIFGCAVAIAKDPALIPHVTKKKFSFKAYSLMPVVFIMLSLCDVLAPLTILNMEAESGSNLAQLYFYGIIFGLLLVILLQKKFQLNLCIMLNLSFALLALGFVIRLIILHYPILIYISTLCFGLAYGIGMVNIYYLAGFMAKKFQNITFYRVGILLSAIFYFSGFGLAYLFRDAYLLLSILSVCIVIAFFALSPMFLRLLYQGEWIDDTYRQDVTFDSRLQSRLKELKLSPQEIQVCTLLLCGYTLRQTASTLALAYPTVNTYCTAIYRKLSINSRAELLLMFKDYKEDTETPPH